MLVFWDARLVFLATPKTGSTALAEALSPLAAMSLQRPPVLKHTTVQRYHRFIAPYLRVSAGEEFTTFALMRDPLDWLGSWYRFRSRADLPDAKNSTAQISFDHFIAAYCTTPQPEYANVGSQARFLTPDGKPPIDNIFCYENMGPLMDFLQDRLGLRPDLPRRNVSPQRTLDLSPALRRQLEQHSARDFDLYAKVAAGAYLP